MYKNASMITNLKRSFINTSVFVLIFIVFMAQATKASAQSKSQSSLSCSMHLSLSQSAPQTETVSRSGKVDLESYRLSQKIYTFPDLHPDTKNHVVYTNEVKGIRQKDQCAQGCSFNAMASYIEAYLSFAQTGHVYSRSSPEISANYMHAIFMFWQFRWALFDLERSVMIGGSLEWSLLEFLSKGLYLEENFRSINTVDVESIRQKLNHRLLQIRAKDPFGSEIDPAKESAFAFSILRDGFGHSALGQSFYEEANSLKNAVVHSISYEQKAVLAESVNVGGETSFQPMKPAQLKNLAEQTIQQQIDRGLPLMLSYRHSSTFLNSSTGVFSNNPSHVPEIGHAALIVGYRLNANGKIDMLKIQNSHANAPFFHMTIKTFHELANALVFL